MKKITVFYALSLLFLFAVVCRASEMQVYPAYEFIHDGGTTFNVVIYCFPTEPIKSYEFKLSFNQSCVRANSVTEGEFFGDYPTFFSSGIIDNTAGTIINIYDLIIGPGNVTTPGVLVSISFTTLTDDGVSQFHIYAAGVTDDTEYLVLTTADGGRRIYGSYPPWDISQDGRCNILDLSGVVSHYANSCNPPGSQRWDIIPDGRCNYLEMSMMVTHLGEVAPAEPSFSAMKAVWPPYYTNNTKIANMMHKYNEAGFTDVMGVFHYTDCVVDTPLLQNLSASAQNEGLSLIPKFAWRNWEDYLGAMDKGLYFNGTALVDSVYVAPSSQMLWTKINSMFVSLAGLSMTTMPNIKGAIFDLELDWPDNNESYWYYGYDAQYDDGTFQRYITNRGLEYLNPPVSHDERFMRYTWLSNYNIIEDYQSFVAQLSYQLAKNLSDAVHAVNPDFFIGFYPSPLWNDGRYDWPIPHRYTNYHYWYPVFFDWIRGFDTHQHFVLMGTELYGGPAPLPGQLTSDGRFDFIREDTQEHIPMYYSCGAIIGYFPPSLLPSLGNSALQANGYWIFNGDFLTTPCDQLYNELIPVIQPGVPAMCASPHDLTHEEWCENCCPGYQQQVLDYILALSQLSDQVG